MRSDFFLSDVYNKKVLAPYTVYIYMEKLGSKKKFNIKFSGQKPVYRLKIIFITSNHEILTQKGWKKLNNITLNNLISTKLLLSIKLLTYYSEGLMTWDKIIKITYEKLVPVYD